jgi:hypothetical protein
VTGRLRGQFVLAVSNKATLPPEVCRFKRMPLPDEIVKRAEALG